MTDELVVKQTADVELPATPRLLVATKPEEMQIAQQHMVDWFTKKLRDSRAEWSEVKDALEVAERNRWGTSALRNQLARAKGRSVFYGKALAAAKAGFALIPNFPVDLFAIRTAKLSPASNISTSSWNNTTFQKAQALPEGEGRYVSDEAYRTHYNTTKKQDGTEVNWFWNQDFKDVAFPVIAMKPEVMEATAKAMAAKIFDEVGLCPQSSKKDPMIIGRILGPKIGYSQTSLNFLICWFIDLKEL